MEDCLALGHWATLELGLDRPRKGSLSESGKDGVDDFGILVLGVEKETVHVEKTGTDGWESMQFS